MQAPANVEARSSRDVDCALSQIRVTASAAQMRVKQRPEQNKPFAVRGTDLRNHSFNLCAICQPAQRVPRQDSP